MALEVTPREQFIVEPQHSLQIKALATFSSGETLDVTRQAVYETSNLNATVDHVEGHSSIKLAKDDDGQHHYIPLEWVTSVDDKVHIDRPGQQAMREWTTTPPKQ